VSAARARVREGEERTYAFEFAPVAERAATARLVCSAEPGAERPFGVSLDDTELARLALAAVPPAAADLLDLAVAVYAADRLAPYHLSRGYRRVRVRLPLRDPDSFEAAHDVLEELLEWTTGSHWTFAFPRRTAPLRVAERASALPFPRSPVEVALWSGGLDALAGLDARVRQDADTRFVLVGVGGSDVMLGRQRTVYDALGGDSARRASLARLPIHLSGLAGYPKNKLSRARGVVYALAGAATAVVHGATALAVYENGVGALNLPYTRAEVGLDHSRSVHPLTLRLVSRFVSAVLGDPFRVHNPFLYSTKAEMLAGLAADGGSGLVAVTSSCDSPHRREPVQCGYCSSCVLRRQSLAAAGLPDDTPYVVPHGEPPVGDTRAYVRLASAQAERLGALASSCDPWEALAREHPVLDDVVDRCAEGEGLGPDAMRDRLIHLLSRHSTDWDAARQTLAQGGLPVHPDHSAAAA
jgi:hypothetical protein